MRALMWKPAESKLRLMGSKMTDSLPQGDFYCPNCGYTFVVVFLDVEPFTTAECDNCGGIAIQTSIEVTP